MVHGSSESYSDLLVEGKLDSELSDHNDSDHMKSDSDKGKRVSELSEYSDSEQLDLAKPDSDDLSDSEYYARSRGRQVPVYELSDEQMMERFDYDDDDEYNEIKAELPILRIHLKQIHLTQGFDIDVWPNVGIMGYTPFDEVVVSEEYERLLTLANSAIDKYNAEEHSNYAVVQVVKANCAPSNCDDYRITFTACEPDEHPKTFQARVVVNMVSNLDDPPYVYICRIKSTDGVAS